MNPARSQQAGASTWGPAQQCLYTKSLRRSVCRPPGTVKRLARVLLGGLPADTAPMPDHQGSFASRSAYETWGSLNHRLQI